MDQIVGSSSRHYDILSTSDVCDHLPQMLGSDKITSEEKIILQYFHSRAAVRLQQIFDSKRHCDRFICTIRGSIREASRVLSDEGVSTFESLFHDTLRDMQVYFINFYIYLYTNLC